MDKKFKYTKELRWIKLSDLSIKEQYRLYKQRERTDLEASIPESGIIQPLTAINHPTLVLLDGHDRYEVMAKAGMSETEVPVWVIRDELSEDQIKKLILDLSRQKQKTNEDYLQEYKLYNAIIPNEQGKNLGGHNRHKLIAGLIGISTGKLSQLIRISKEDPILVQKVDCGRVTLAEAEQKAKAMKREKREEKPDKKQTRSHDFAKKFDVGEVGSGACPTCKRPFGEMKWEEIPGYFTHGRNETNGETDWLEPLDDETAQDNETSKATDDEE